MAESSVFKARLKAVTVLVDRQLYGSEFHTNLKQFHEKYLRRNYMSLFTSKDTAERQQVRQSSIL